MITGQDSLHPPRLVISENKLLRVWGVCGVCGVGGVECDSVIISVRLCFIDSGAYAWDYTIAGGLK
jgi:hypothetical protein